MSTLRHIFASITLFALLATAPLAYAMSTALADDLAVTCQPADTPFATLSTPSALPTSDSPERSPEESRGEMHEPRSTADDGLAHPTHSTTRIAEAITLYQAIAKAGGWPSVQPGSVLRMGDVSPRVRALRERLAITGDLSSPSETPRLAEEARLDEDLRFDAEVDRAVRRFQARHGLEVDGIVGPQTIGALNVSAEDRADELEENARRQKEAQTWASTHVYANLPAFEIYLVEDNITIMKQRTIIGTPRTATPEFSTRITHAVLAPYWNVPESIARRTIYPRAMEDPSYLARHGFVQMESGVLRQNPGPTNFLGRIKFHIPNNMSIGLHDTPERNLFARHQRAYSSGCIRLEDPLALAEYLLQDTEWSRHQINVAINRNTERWITIPNPVPLHIVYWTAWVDEDGTVHFRDDLYGRMN